MTESGSDREAWLVEVSDDCVSSAQCIITASDLFALNDDGFSIPRHNPVDLTRSEDLHEAVDGCPSGAIRITRQLSSAVTK
jgi:ferredoxin